MIHLVRGFGIALLVYLVGLMLHFLWEAWLIIKNGFDLLPECRRWWCPDGFRNRRRAALNRREKYWWS